MTFPAPWPQAAGFLFVAVMDAFNNNMTMDEA